MWADGGGRVRGAATRSLHGQEAVARIVIASLKKLNSNQINGISVIYQLKITVSQTICHDARRSQRIASLA